MVLKSSRLMPKFNSRYCGMCWYLANSAAQAAGDNGGRMPVIGSHSVIERPERVSLVTPPITTIRKIMAQHTRSQMAIGRRLSSAAGAAEGGASVIAVGRVTPGLAPGGKP